MKALACGLLVFFVAPIAWAEEPSVGGLTASEWAHRLLTEDWPKIDETREQLARFGEAALPVLRDLARRPDGPKSEAARILAKIRPKEALGLYLALLDEEPDYPRFVVRWIGELGPIAAPAVERVADVLESGEWETREAAAKALGRIGMAAVPALKEALRDRDPDVRKVAAQALGWIEPPARSAAPDLKATLDDPKIYTRGAAAFALLWIEPTTPGVARVLLEQDLEGTAWRIDARFDVRDNVEALAPDLVRVLFGPSRGLRDLATSQLFYGATTANARHPERRASPDLSRFVAEARTHLGAEEPELEALAACLLARAAPDEPELAEALVRALRTGRKEIRIEAARALRILGPAGRIAAPDLIGAARATDPELAEAAALALPRVGAPPEEAVPLLLSGLRGELPGLRRESSGHALAGYGEAGLAALPILSYALGEEIVVWSGHHRTNPRSVKGSVWPARVLASFGPLAAPAVPALLESTTWDRKGGPPEMEWAAQRAILAIGDVALPAVMDALDGDAFPTAAAVLAKMGPRARPAADRLRPNAPADGDGPWTAIVALARAEPGKPESVGPLRAALENGVWSESHRSSALGLLGPEDAALLPILLPLLATDDVEERYRTARVVHRVGGDAGPSVDALVVCLDAGICPRSAAEVLALAGERKGEIVARIVTLCEVKESGNLLRALAGAGAAGAPAIPILQRVRRTLRSYRENLDEDLRLILRSIRQD